MATLKDILCYLIDKYPYKNHLSNARITKMIYLADWYSANIYKKQVSDIHWVFNNFGPFVDDVIQTAQNNPNLFAVKEVENFYGASKRMISTVSPYNPTLSEDEKQSLDTVVEITKNKTWDQFITFVYSTYPIVVSNRYSTLDLLSLAEEYQAKRRESK